MMFLKSKKEAPSQEKGAQDAVARAQVVMETFEGKSADNELPPLVNLVVLLWMFRDDDKVTRYLVLLIETHVMQKPELADQVEIYLPQFTNLALSYWDSRQQHKASEGDDNNINTIERLLLIIAQISTRFALQYHWTLQSLLLEQQPEKVHSGKTNNTFDTQLYVQCMALSANLERCMNGHRRKKPKTPALEIVACYGGKVTNDEFVAVEPGSPQSYYETVVAAAEDNASHAPLLSDASKPVEVSLQLPMKDSFGGVLMFKRQHRKTGRRKTWKKRYFAVEEGMLNCYGRSRQLLRSLPLDGATMWKGPQKKYPHSFIVANDEVMFHLRASTEEQKALWKRKLQHVIRDSSPEEQLSPTQLERRKAYQNGKWFSRMLTETTQELDGIVAEDRQEYLFERFFELEVPKHIVWPWREVKSKTDKHVYVVLPHFSHILSNASLWQRNSLPRYQATFWLAENPKRQLHDSSVPLLDQQQKSPDSLALPDTLEEILLNLRQDNTRQDDKDLGSSFALGDGVAAATSNLEFDYETSETTDVESSDDDVGAEEEMPTILRKVEIEYISPTTNFNSTNTDNDEASVGSCSSSASSQTSLLEDLSLGDDLDDLEITYPKDNNETSREEAMDDAAPLSEGHDFSVEMEYKEVKGESDASQNAKNSQNLVSLQTKEFRQDEMLLTQQMYYLQSLCQREGVDLWVFPPRARRISIDAAIMELPRGRMSIGQAKQSISGGGSLREYMIERTGGRDSYSFELAKENFMRSLAGLSLVSYLLGLRELDEDNIEIDDEGHLYMVDISRALGSDLPGLRFNAEVLDPLKVKKDYLQAMDGPNSDLFQRFQESVLHGLMVARKDAMVSISLIKMTSETIDRKHGEKIIRTLKQKLMLDEDEAMFEKKSQKLVQRPDQHLLVY